MQSHDFPPSAFFSPFLFYTTFTNYPTITRFRTGGERTRSKVYYLHAEQTLPTAASGAARGEQPDYFWQPYDEFWAQERAERAACAVLCGACGGWSGHHCAGGAYCPSLGLAVSVCATGLFAGDGTGDCRRYRAHSRAWGAGA